MFAVVVGFNTPECFQDVFTSFSLHEQSGFSSLHEEIWYVDVPEKPEFSKQWLSAKMEELRFFAVSDNDLFGEPFGVSTEGLQSFCLTVQP